MSAALARWISGVRTGVTIVPMDDFYLPSALRLPGGAAEKPLGADFDWRRLERQVLMPLAGGLPARYQGYDWALDSLGAWHEVTSGGIVVVEGVYSTRREIAGAYDLTIWVDCPREVRLSRGLARDGDAARGTWESDWMPAEDRYVEEHGPRERAGRVRVIGV